MNRYLLIIFILIIGCEQPDLQHTTAAALKGLYQQEKGQNAVMLNFWATSCAPCVEEFPMIVDLSDEYENELSVYFISMDWLDEKEKAISFLKKQGVDGVTFIKDEKDNPFINGIHLEWSGAIPFTILYGKASGEVVDFWESEQSKERFRKAIINAINS